MNILTLLTCFDPYLVQTHKKQLGIIITAILSMTGRVTMLGISRWTEAGGSYRTIQRFFQTNLPWTNLFWIFFQTHLWHRQDDYILAGDETIVTKSGTETHGLDRFFASIFGRPVPGVSFFSFALVNVSKRTATPLLFEQRVRSEAEKEVAKENNRKREKNTKNKTGGKRGRPKGSKNKNKQDAQLTHEFLWIQGLLKQLLSLINQKLPLTYVVLDGHFGHNAGLRLVQQCGLHLVSKLKHNAALYFPYDGEYSGKGRPNVYGDKVDYAQLTNDHLISTSMQDQIQTKIYSFQARHKSFPDALNVAIIVKYNLDTKKEARVILFTSDLAVSAEKIIDFYQLRFQIEFNFRDAKQYWGLEDFMATSQQGVTNSAALSMFMVSVSQAVLPQFRTDDAVFGVLDLKAHFRGYKYVREVLKLLPKYPDEFLISRIFDTISRLGGIHPPS